MEHTTLKNLTGESDLQNGYSYMELPKDLTMNVNSGNTLNGPVRCGSFGWSSTTQAQAGATFWGLMEMSGNLSEICYNIAAASYFNTSSLYTSHGNGEVNSSTGNTDISTSIWGNSASYFALKGGSYASEEERLRVSDRSVLSVDLAERDPEVGFRAVRTFGGSVVVNPGTITAPATGCLGSTIKINNSTLASMNWNGKPTDFEITYSWYVANSASGPWTRLKGETGISLEYQVAESIGTAASVTYYFKRRAESIIGYAEVISSATTIPSLDFSSVSGAALIPNCGNITSLTVTPRYSSAVITWHYKGGSALLTGKVYTPAKAHFNNVCGSLNITCRVNASGCMKEYSYPVVVECAPSCGESVSYGGESYGTKLIGAQCWMTKNMNIGTRVAGTNYNTHNEAGVQKICYNNSEANCTTYGGLYNWNEAVNGEKVGTPNYKYATDGSGYIQGICPDGWHVPSDEEWKCLEMTLGMTQNQANATDWRGTDQGRKLKSTDLWTNYSGTTGTNTSGFNGRPGGYRLSSNGTFYNLETYGSWWSSTPSSSNGWRRTLSYSEAGVYRTNYNKAYGFSVRCLRN